MAIAHDHAAVKTVISGFSSRHNFNLCGEEIILFHSILFGKNSKNIRLHTILNGFLLIFLLRSRDGTDQQIQTLSLDDLGCLFLHLIS